MDRLIPLFLVVAAGVRLRHSRTNLLSLGGHRHQGGAERHAQRLAGLTMERAIPSSRRNLTRFGDA